MIGTETELQRTLARAAELLQQGPFEQAAAACHAVLAVWMPNHSAATHPLGLARERVDTAGGKPRLFCAEACPSSLPIQSFD